MMGRGGFSLPARNLGTAHQLSSGPAQCKPKRASPFTFQSSSSRGQPAAPNHTPITWKAEGADEQTKRTPPTPGGPRAPCDSRRFPFPNGSVPAALRLPGRALVATGAARRPRRGPARPWAAVRRGRPPPARSHGPATSPRRRWSCWRCPAACLGPSPSTSPNPNPSTGEAGRGESPCA